MNRNKISYRDTINDRGMEEFFHGDSDSDSDGLTSKELNLLYTYIIFFFLEKSKKVEYDSSNCSRVSVHYKDAISTNNLFGFQRSQKFQCFAASLLMFSLLTPLKCNAIPAESNGYIRSSTGIEFYDYRVGDGENTKLGDKVVFNYKGRLAGRQGWQYDDTFLTGEPVRLTLGKSPCISGLELGLVGDNHEMPPMKKGGKRRLVLPAKLGYKNKEQLPIPKDFGQRQRLYSTVLNAVRDDRETEALGDSLVGIVVLDVDLLRVKTIVNNEK